LLASHHIVIASTSSDCHCEQSVAIHTLTKPTEIASGLSPLAMTGGMVLLRAPERYVVILESDAVDEMSVHEN